jgi:hypothetical protein
MFRSRLLVLTAAFGLSLGRPAFAQSGPDDAAIEQARAEFRTATEHVKQAQWAEALAAFERSAALRPHAITTYNIGACERALGRYVRAREALRKALALDAKTGQRDLPQSFADDATRWLDELSALLVRATVTLTPPDATLHIDGGPAIATDDGLLVAGLPAGANSVKTPGARFTLLLDPGEHVFSLSRPGFVTAAISRSFHPGSTPDVHLDVVSLPATIRVTANRPGAVVSVDDLDTGVAPVELSRPAGTYRVAVRKAGFVPYLTTVRVNPGDQPSLHAPLSEETVPVYKKVWFWAAATAVVAGAAVGTYFLTRPEHERPRPDGGALGWVVTVPAPGSR